MKLHLDADRLPAIKRRLREAFPSSKPSVRIEAFARGVDFKTHAALLSALQTGPRSVELNDAAFEQYFIAHSVQPAPRTFRRAVIRACIEPLLETNWRLTAHGYGVPDSYGGSGPLYTEEMARSRAAFFDDRFCDQFELALLFLQNCDRRKTLNRNASSYGMKHTAENISREFGVRTDLGNYVANGVFIAAAAYDGYELRPVDTFSLNAYLNISERSRKLFKDRDWVRHRLTDQPI